MLFLSFQEFLTYFHQEVSKLQGSALLQDYLEQYRMFCRSHHVCGNHHELLMEGILSVEHLSENEI